MIESTTTNTRNTRPPFIASNMSTIINIGGSTDPFYRYTMPVIETKIEGRGNGVRTVLTNIGAVAVALSRPADEIMAMFKLKLGTRAKDSTINGEFAAHDLQRHLSDYVETFVLCAACSNPETRYSVHSTYIRLVCAACGAKGDKIHSAPPISFILKRGSK